MHWLKNLFHRQVNEKTVDIGNGITIELIWCPPGRFYDGAVATTEKGRQDKRNPT